MMAASPEGVSSIHIQAGQTQTSNAMIGMGTGRGSSSTLRSGGNSHSLSSFVMINQDISAFIDQQVDMDAARDMKSQVPKPVVVADQSASSSAQDRQEKDVQVGRDRLKDFVPDILLKSDKNAAILGQVEAPGVTQEPQPQTAQKGEGQERQDDQPKVMAPQDRVEIATTSNAASSNQEPAAHALGVESRRSATETASIESQKEGTLEKTPAVLSPKEQEGYLKIRQYVRREGEPEELVVFDQHYKADPDHAIAFRKSLLSGDKDFKAHMAKPYVPDALVKEKPQLDPAVLKAQAFNQEYLKIRQYVQREGEPEELVVFDQHYKADPDHAIAFRKSLLTGDKDFKKHMAKPYS